MRGEIYISSVQIVCVQIENLYIFTTKSIQMFLIFGDSGD